MGFNWNGGEYISKESDIEYKSYQCSDPNCTNCKRPHKDFTGNPYHAGSDGKITPTVYNRRRDDRK